MPRGPGVHCNSSGEPFTIANFALTAKVAATYEQRWADYGLKTRKRQCRTKQDKFSAETALSCACDFFHLITSIACIYQGLLANLPQNKTG